MILGITGRRNIPNIKENLTLKIKEISPDLIITGMALGSDMLVAEIAIDLNIKFVAALPFIGQEELWKEEDKKRYSNLLNKADKVQIVSEGGFANWKYQIRNEWIVNKSDKILGVWDGIKQGGTYNCLKYAKSNNKEIILFKVKNEI